MADDAEKTENGFNQTVVKQVGWLIGIAISVALAVTLVLWLQKPDYAVLYPGLESRDAAQVVEALNQMGITHSIQARTGAILVPHQDMQKAKLHLASQGLPHGSSRGYEMLEKGTDFGTSQFMEIARFRRALENELARTISSMQPVRSARVHLAIPKEPVFIRDRRKSSASVFVDLFSGRRLDKFQVDAIINMVAASVPEMRTDDVTVVDQKGRLLTSGDEADSFAITQRQLDTKRRIEAEYLGRVNNLLTPILGQNRFRTQVTAEIDFTNQQEAAERYSPDKGAIRSAQYIAIDKTEEANAAGGVPGALTNQPPIVEETQADEQDEVKTDDKKIRSTENYELDKTVSYTKKQPWRVDRLSIAVAVDDKAGLDEEGNAIRTPVSAEEIEQLNQLVKNAVGFSQARGDVVEVINMSFIPPEAIAELPPIPIYQQAWFMQIIKYVLGSVGLLLLVFGVIKPLINKIINPPVPVTALPSVPETAALGGELDTDELTLTHEAMAPSLPQPSSAYGARMETVRSMVREHPGRVAEVVMDWVGEEENSS